MKTIPVRKIHPEPHKPDSFGIRSLDNLLADQPMIQHLHRHDYFFLLAVKSGNGSHTIDFTTYPVADTTLFFMRPRQVHELQLEKGCKGFILEFTPDFPLMSEQSTHLLRQGTGLDNFFQPTAESASHVFDLLQSMLTEFTLQPYGYKDVLRARLHILLIELHRMNQQGEIVKTRTSSITQERLQLFMELLEKNIFQHKQVSDYASMMHLSTFQLNSITKQLLGKNCSEIITDHLLLEAKRNLLSTNAQVKEIAYDLGFEDVSYFIRFFRKHTGHTPEAFRQNSR